MWWGIVMVVASVLVANQVASQSAKAKGKAKPPSKEEQEAMMKKYMEMAAPGKAHKAMEQFVGRWETTVRAWMRGPGSPPSESKGTTEVKSIFDGRFVVEELSGQFMEMPFKGFGITGYDNFRKQYIGVWLDNMGTAMLTMQGHLDKSGKVLTMHGLMDEPMTGERNKKVKYVTRIVSKDKRVFELYAQLKR